MQNPFKYGGIVGGASFCDREREQRELRRAAENGDRLLIFAERRMGKTSLVRRVLEDLPPRSFIPIYVDLWPTHDAASMALAIASAVADAAETRAEKTLETAKQLFRHLIPSLTLDEAGLPVLLFGARPGAEPQPQLEDVLEAPQRLADARGKSVVVVFDEIQRLGEFDDDLAERVLRSRIQQHRRIAYFLLGSRKHLVEQMFTDSSRPLYQSAGHYPLGPIPAEAWAAFIIEGFERTGRSVAADVVGELCSRTGGHPYYTQHLAHALWEMVEDSGAASMDDLEEAQRVLLDRIAYTYTVLWEALPGNQRTVLRGLAEEAEEAQPFSAAFLGRTGLAASSAHQAARGLIEKDVVERTEDGYLIGDRFLRLWVRRRIVGKT